jgi:hypothetical protein
LAVSNALGVTIKDGKFFAQIDDFYKQELLSIRQREALDNKVKAIS